MPIMQAYSASPVRRPPGVPGYTLKTSQLVDAILLRPRPEVLFVVGGAVRLADGVDASLNLLARDRGRGRVPRVLPADEVLERHRIAVGDAAHPPRQKCEDVAFLAGVQSHRRVIELARRRTECDVVAEAEDLLEHPRRARDV